MEIVNISPLADDVDRGLGPMWLPLRPGSDVAVMLALAYVLVDEGRADLEFCRRYCVGADRLIAYITGATDGVAKTPAWASALSAIPAATLVTLARRMSETRTMVTTSWSLQRAEYGEQPVWMSIALAALLGQIGLPGGGFGNGYASLGDIGGGATRVAVPALPGGGKGSTSWIPVARVADMLLDPGGTYDFDGERRVYPDIRLVYWTGGNPFHHHQDLGRLRQAFRRPETIVVNEPYWTAMARHADVVLPATITLERNDIAAGRADEYVIAMQQALEPYGEARDDFAIFSGLAARLGLEPAFSEGRDEHAWLRWIYERLSKRLADVGEPAPSFEEFWSAGQLRLPMEPEGRVFLADFRDDPDANPLRTPSGRIELFSDVIDAFGYDDCPPHPTWLEPLEWSLGARAATFPLLLVANNPATRLHSQLDPGGTSQAAKVAGREPIRMHPDDAASRGISAGDVVRVWNDRGACLAGAVLTEAVMAGVVQLSTGAWYDPDDPSAERPLCVHGNPNVLTADKGTSRLAQGCTGQHVLVDVERFGGPAGPEGHQQGPAGPEGHQQGPAPPVRAHRPPTITSS
jgi:biotin/methionine sulfoxide reductase